MIAVLEFLAWTAGEKVDLSKLHPSIVADMWEQLNRTLLTTFKARSPASMLGVCNEACAAKH